MKITDLITNEVLDHRCANCGATEFEFTQFIGINAVWTCLVCRWESIITYTEKQAAQILDGTFRRTIWS